MSPRILLLSFAGGGLAWSTTRSRFIREARKSMLFDDVVVLRPSDLGNLSSLDWARSANFLQSGTRGFGYWAWKPAVIQWALQSKSYDVILYADVGCSISSDERAREKLGEWVAGCRRSGVLSFELPNLEIEFTKQAVIEEYSRRGLRIVEAEGQLMGGISVWDTNSKVAHEVCEDWLELSSRDNGLLLLDAGSMEENSRLIAHRHDQSLFSLAVKSRNIPPIPDCTYFPDRWASAEALRVPILQTRHKGILPKFTIEKFLWAKAFHFFELGIFKVERHLLAFCRSVRQSAFRSNQVSMTP